MKILNTLTDKTSMVVEDGDILCVLCFPDGYGKERVLRVIQCLSETVECDLIKENDQAELAGELKGHGRGAISEKCVMEGVEKDLVEKVYGK